MSALGKVIVAVGTYDGVLAGWEMDREEAKFKITFATPVHEGSVRSVSMAQPHGETSPSSSSNGKKKKKSTPRHRVKPGSLLSCGYDEVLRTHDFTQRLNSSGEVRTPTEFGTPACSAFAPPMALGTSSHDTPPPPGSTHCIVGFSEGKLVIYKKKDWTVQHVLAGHDGGVACIAVHPSGKMALTGGETDGKIKLWDLTKGRLAFVSKIIPSQAKNGKTQYDAVACIVWTTDESGPQAYAFCYGNHITVREVSSGEDLLDVDLPSRVNQVCLLSVEEGLFVAAACNDGSLPVLAVEEDSKSEERRAIMAIEPVDGPVAGEERFKCIQALVDGHVVTANSAGVVTLMDLRGAIRMITTENKNEGPSGDSEKDGEQSDSDDNASEEEELAVEIIDAVQLGSGARVTSLAAWCGPLETEEGDFLSESDEEEDAPASGKVQTSKDNLKKRGRPEGTTVTMDEDALKRARTLVASARKIQAAKRHKKNNKKQVR